MDALPDAAADPYPAIQARTGLGECLMNLGRPAEAKPYLQAAYDMRRKAVDTLPAVKVNALSIARLAEAIDLLVRVCEATGDAAEAAKWRTERAKYPPDPAPAPRLFK